ncbi:hypothetical protein ACLESD_36375 [Pyxidicoccus sp. 3LFB2]
MSMQTRGSRQRAVGMSLGLFLLGGLLPEGALAARIPGGLLPEMVLAARNPGGLLPEVAMAQYGTSRRVARRTSRRTAERHDAYSSSTAVVAVPASAHYVTALPGGCAATVVGAITYQQCGAVRYRPYYQGSTLVYVVE